VVPGVHGGDDDGDVDDDCCDDGDGNGPLHRWYLRFMMVMVVMMMIVVVMLRMVRVVMMVDSRTGVAWGFAVECIKCEEQELCKNNERAAKHAYRVNSQESNGTYR
jgi:hypothetical protein